VFVYEFLHGTFDTRVVDGLLEVFEHFDKLASDDCKNHTARIEERVVLSLEQKRSHKKQE
jgi:hypothetical protein